jgi:transposase InsO family protein
MREKKITKKELAKKLGVSRAALYYKSKREAIDQEIKIQILSVLKEHKYYGHKRIALALKLNKKRILRVMKKYKIKPKRRRLKGPKKPKDKEEAGFKNLIKNQFPIRPNVIWVSDFTYLKYRGKFIYLAVIMDLYSRDILGLNILRIHSSDLILKALKQALKRGTPIYHHSEQGSEYDSRKYVKVLSDLGIKISMSKKASPWENGHLESFFGKLKEELEDINRFKTLPELIEKIYGQIHYYNNKRIHRILKCPPVEFRKNYEKVMQFVSKKMGT